MKTITLNVKGSKFIGFSFETDSEEVFKTNLEAVSKEHQKATHIVYAYDIKHNQKFFDAKEPKRTAGYPLLSLIQKKKLSNIAIIVVRYFGGTKLGASNLLRTYLNVGKALLE